EDDVDARGGDGDGVGRAARADGLYAPDVGRQRADAAHRALVAQHRVPAAAQRDGVRAEAAENGVVGAAGDGVVAAARRVGGDDVPAVEAEVGDAVVAEDHVVVRPGLGMDLVAARAAQDDVGAAVAGDGVLRARGAGGRDLGDLRGALRVDRSVAAHDSFVADHGVGAAAERDRVAARAAQDGVVRAAGNGVVAAGARVAGLDVPGAAEAEVGEPVIAQDHVLALTGVGMNLVAARAAEDDVAAAGAGDDVLRAGGAGGLDARDDRRAAGLQRRIAAHRAFVAHHGVGTAAERDRVATRAAEDGVVRATADRVA